VETQSLLPGFLRHAGASVQATLLKIINRLNKLAKTHGISQRRTFVKEIKLLCLDIRHRRNVKKRTKGQACLETLENDNGHLDPGTEKRTAVVLPV